MDDVMFTYNGSLTRRVPLEISKWTVLQLELVVINFKRIRQGATRCFTATLYLSTPMAVAWVEGVQQNLCVCWCVSLFFPHDISKTDAVMMTKLYADMVRHESRKYIYFRIKKSKVKVVRSFAYSGPSAETLCRSNALDQERKGTD